MPTTADLPDPYPSNLVVAGVPVSATVQSVQLNGVNHTFLDDVDIVLQSPSGTNVISMSDAGGLNDGINSVWTFNDAAGAMSDAGAIPSGTYRPTNYGATDPFVAPGPGSLTQATPTLSSFGTATHNGTWKLFIVDDLGGDIGNLANNWSITFTLPATGIFSPTTGLFTDPAATIPYTGGLIGSVYASPTNTTNYTVSAPLCPSATAMATVTVNPATVVTTQPATTGNVCAGSSVSFTGAGTGSGTLTYQWQISVGGGPFANLPAGAPYTGTTTPTLTINPVAASMNGNQYRLVITGGCGTATSNAATLNVDQIAQTGVAATIVSACTPGSITVTGTAVNGSAGNYTHGLTGPGTITANPPTGPNNSTGNFTVTNIPAGNHSYVFTSTDAAGCSVSTTLPVTINPTPVITITPASSTICIGGVQQLTASVVPGVTQTFTSSGVIQLPATSTTSGPASPYPATLVVSGIPAGSTVRSVSINGISHSFPDDVDILLQSPANVNVLLMSDAGGGADLINSNFVFDDAAATTMPDAALIASGTYKPTNYVTPDNFVAPGPLSITQATPTIASFGSGNMNGTWNLFAVDDLGGDIGSITSFSVTFNVPAQVTFSPTTNVFTDPAATVPYTGTPTNVVYVKPTITTTYTASSTISGCTGTATSTVTVNTPPAITVQPVAPAAPVCPGFSVTFNVTATGSGLTYQWQQNGTNLVDNAQVSGANTNTLTISNVNASNAGAYRVIVSGSCPPSVTSNAVTLVVATPPTITTQPVNRTVCEGGTTTFSVVAGGTPTPAIYQWQLSTDGVTFNNLTTNGSFTPTLTVPNVTLSMNGYRYRVIVTNSCGQSTTSSIATLTVNPSPAVTIAPLPSRICISDTLIPLVGSPVGGSFSGIGVSGFNFVPTATAVGTYTLTYTYTSPLNCTSTATVLARVEDCPERLRLLRDDALILYPNPNNGRFNVRINSTLYNYLGLKIYNVQGQLINGNIVNNAMSSPTYGGLVFGRVISVDISHYPAGIYMVKFYYDDGVRTSEKAFKVVVGAH